MGVMKLRWSLPFVLALLLAGLAIAGDRGAGDSANSASFVPPPNARWTIICQVFTGDTHQADATRAKEYWIHRTGLPGFYIIHEQNQSTLYYGYYQTISGKGSERAQADRRKIEQLANDTGDRPFLGCIFVELIPKDPPAPAEWNLVNAKGYWSLQVGVYESDPRRKEVAVESVRDMRAHGIDAYFYHGPTASSVCIGTWPKDAVKQEQAKPNPDEPVLVSNRPVGNGDIRLRSGQKVQEVVPKVQILDPSLRAMMEKYPYEAINGEMELRDANGKLIKGPTPSYIVVIPHQQSPAGGTASDQTDDSTQLPPAFLPPPPPPTDSATSGLRSIDSK